MNAFRSIALIAIIALTVLGLLWTTGAVDVEFLTTHALKLGGILSVLIVAILSFKLLARDQKSEETEKPPLL